HLADAVHVRPRPADRDPGHGAHERRGRPAGRGAPALSAPGARGPGLGDPGGHGQEQEQDIGRPVYDQRNLAGRSASPVEAEPRRARAEAGIMKRFSRREQILIGAGVIVVLWLGLPMVWGWFGSGAPSAAVSAERLRAARQEREQEAAALARLQSQMERMRSGEHTSEVQSLA